MGCGDMGVWEYGVWGYGSVGVWGVGCGTIPTKGRLSGNEYFGYDSFQQSDSPLGLARVCLVILLFLQQVSFFSSWDALPTLSPQTLLAWPLDAGFWSPALSPVSQRQSYREPSPPPLTPPGPRRAACCLAIFIPGAFSRSRHVSPSQGWSLWKTSPHGERIWGIFWVLD